jgi:formylglycine-generating enzyme required for sulfatase activity
MGRGEAGSRVHFPAAESFVGTDRPVIEEDGEGPRRSVTLAPFALETVTVTNARFARFVAATGYVTEAEQFGSAAVFRALLGPHDGAPGRSSSLWLSVDRAFWREPEGPGSTIVGREDHPVVQVSWRDASAFAVWCGGRLPSEAEWEHAARGGLPDPRFPWGDDEPDDDTVFANIWQGRFPDLNLLTDGYLGTSPSGAFPPNGAGLYDMSGNVWEWTADSFRVTGLNALGRNLRAITDGEKVLKGGSFLCHRNHCYRYRIAARSALSAQSCASNTGFRVAYDH